MPGDQAAARTLLKGGRLRRADSRRAQSTDNPLGEVTADLLRRIGIKTDLASSDWGTVVQRRSSREPVEKGGWSILHSYGSATGYANPAGNPLLRGAGLEGWFGGWNSPAKRGADADLAER